MCIASYLSLLTLAPIIKTQLGRTFLAWIFSRYSYLVSRRMSLYGLPSIKRSPRLITVDIVHKVNSAIKYKNSQVQINLTWRTNTWGPAFPEAGRVNSIIELPQELSCIRFLLLPSPKSHPHCQVCPWQGSASTCAEVQKLTQRNSGSKTCTDGVNHYYHFLWTCLGRCRRLS